MYSSVPTTESFDLDNYSGGRSYMKLLDNYSGGRSYLKLFLQLFVVAVVTNYYNPYTYLFTAYK